MNNEDFILFVTTLLEKINNVDINNDIRIKIKKSDLNSIQLFNFKILATRKLEDANIGIIVSSSGWTIIYGSIYSNILTSNLPSKFKNSDDLISMAENTAITFFDLAMGKVPFVLHLSTVNIKSPNGSIIERLPSIAQFFEKINKKYSQICTTFPNIIDGWDQDQDNPNIKYKLINTIKIMRI
ncbi:MAG: hypothetical protein Q7T41_00420, partial [Candidatus Saccharibacteria bacterium]|nr:hypothetical protein [Candidatus Saccharibacteria bacterium]